MKKSELKKLIKEEIKKLQKEETIAQIEDFPKFCTCAGEVWSFTSPHGMQGWDCDNLCTYVLGTEPFPDGITATKGGDKGYQATGNTMGKINKRRAFNNVTNLQPLKHMGPKIRQ